MTGPRAALVALGAGLLVAGAALAAYSAVRSSEAGTAAELPPAIVTTIQELGTMLRDAHSQARAAADLVASNDFVQKGTKIADPATVMDQVRYGEAKYQVGEGELLEIGAVTAQGYKTLAVQPATAAPSGFGARAGSYEKLDGSRVFVYEVSQVTYQGVVTGHVTYAKSRDVTAALARLAAAGANGRLEVGQAALPIGNDVAVDAPRSEAVLTEAGARVVLQTAPVASPSRQTGLFGGIALGLGGIVLLALVTLRRERPAVPRTFTTSAMTTTPVAPALPSQGESVGASLALGPTQLQPAQPDPDPERVTRLSAEVPAVRPGIRPGSLGPGAMIGRWEVIRRLGSGGMADVFLARSKGEAGFQKLVAIKVMHDHLARNHRAIELFLDEARLAAQIQHPNVVAIFDLGKIGDEYVIVMEYVDGVDLERLLVAARERQRGVPLPVALGILTRLCDGLHAAHTAVDAGGTPLGLIHRDVKSANVLVSRQGVVKVGDFGIAKATAQSHLTAMGETKGTPSMMAPEQRVGDQVDVRADVYSVAAVGYELVTGRAINLDLAALAHLGVDGWPHLPRPSSVRPELPSELDDILLTAMAFERQHRPADCEALATTIEEVMKRHAIAASDKDIARWVEAELAWLGSAVSPLETTDPRVEGP